MFEDELIPLFEDCGTIWDLRLMMDPMTGTNRGYAFVTFTNREAAVNAVRQVFMPTYRIATPNPPMKKKKKNATRFPPKEPSHRLSLDLNTAELHWPSIKRFMFTYKTYIVSTITILHTISIYNYFCITYFTYILLYMYNIKIFI